MASGCFVLPLLLSLLAPASPQRLTRTRAASTTVPFRFQIRPIIPFSSSSSNSRVSVSASPKALFGLRTLRVRRVVSAGAKGDGNSLVEQLTQLKSLVDAGVLTEEEFAKAKTRLIEGNTAGESGGGKAGTDGNPGAIQDPTDSAKEIGRMAGRVFKERVKEWSQLAEEATVVAPAVLKAAQKVAAPRVASAAESLVNSTVESVNNLDKFSGAIGRILERKGDAALNQAENYRNAAASVVKNRANKFVMSAIGVESPEGALAWAADLEAKASKLENLAAAPDRALASVFNAGDAKKTSEEDAAKVMAVEAAQVEAVREAVEAAEAAQDALEAIKRGEMPDVWAPTLDQGTGRTYYWNYKTRETTWERPEDGAVVLNESPEEPSSSGGSQSEGTPSSKASS